MKITTQETTTGLIVKFENDSERFSGGLNGVGAASTVATSKRTDVKVHRNNKEYTLSFKEGKPGFFEIPEDPTSKFTPLTDLTYVKEDKDLRPALEKKLWKTGTTVKTWLDDNVYTSRYPINRLDITERLRGTSFLLPGLEIEIYNEVDKIEVDGKRRDGVLTSIDNRIDARTGSVAVRAEFANPQHRLLPGGSVTILFRPQELPSRVMVPAAAVQQDPQGFFSWVLKPDHTAGQRRLTLAGQQGQQFAVEKGLQAGEQVITDGAQRLREGAAVQVLN